MDTQVEKGERRKPSFGTAILSSPFLTNLVFSGLLAASCLMPIAVGCDEKTVLVPAKVLKLDSDEGLWESLAVCFAVFWPYGFGAGVTILLVTIAIVRPRRLGNWLLPLPLTLLVVLFSFAILALVFTDKMSEVGVVVLGFVLPTTGLLVFCLATLRRHGTLLAAVRCIRGLSFFATLGVYLASILMFSSRFLYGFYTSIAAALGLSFTSWLLFTRGERCFSDLDAAVRPAQFRVGGLLAWTVLIAMLIAAYQTLPRGPKSEPTPVPVAEETTG